MNTRIMTSISLWVSIILALVIFRDAGVFILGFIAYFAQLELYQMFEKGGSKPMKQIGLISGAILMFGSFYFGDLSNDLFLLTFLFITLYIISLDVKNGNFDALLPTLFGFIYIPYLLHFIFKIYHLNIQEGYSTDSSVFSAFGLSSLPLILTSVVIFSANFSANTNSLSSALRKQLRGRLEVSPLPPL